MDFDPDRLFGETCGRLPIDLESRQALKIRLGLDGTAPAKRIDHDQRPLDSVTSRRHVRGDRPPARVNNQQGQVGVKGAGRAIQEQEVLRHHLAWEQARPGVGKNPRLDRDIGAEGDWSGVDRRVVRRHRAVEGVADRPERRGDAQSQRSVRVNAGLQREDRLRSQARTAGHVGGAWSGSGEIAEEIRINPVAPVRDVGLLRRIRVEGRDDIGLRINQRQVTALLGQLEIGVERRRRIGPVIPGRPDQQILAGGEKDAGHAPFHPVGRCIGQEPATQVRVLRAGVVDLQPVRTGSVFVFDPIAVVRQ